jgi:hypothetical protein
LTARATRQFEARKERQFEAEQRERILDARHLKFIRLDHLELRQQQAQHHEATRERKTDDRVQAMRQTAERNLRQELQRLQSQDREPHPRPLTGRAFFRAVERPLDWGFLRCEAKYMIGEEFVQGVSGRHRCQPLRGRDARRAITLLIGWSAPVVMGGPSINLESKRGL